MFKSTNPSLSLGIKKMYLRESTANFHFIFESSDGTIERVPCHRFVLIAYSEVFRAMIDGSWKEKNEVKIVDASKAAFEEFLKFFYFDEVNIATEYALEVYLLGQKYLMTSCMNACIQNMCDNLTVENVCSIFDLSLFIDHADLKKWCKVMICLNAPAVFKSNGFIECSQQALKEIIKWDSLFCPEINVFNACMAWIRAASNRKTLDKELIDEYLGDSFNDIRFGLMTLEQIGRIFASHKNLFTAAECKEITRVVKAKRAVSQTVNQKPRKSICDEKTRIKCVRPTQKDNSLYRLSDIETTTFTTNASLLLRAIVFGELLESNIYLVRSVNKDVMAKLTIIEDRDPTKADFNRIVYTQDAVCLNISRNRCNVIELMKPVFIKPQYTYRISYELHDTLAFGTPYFTTFRLSASQIQIQVGTTIEFINDPRQNDRIRGLIYGLNFNSV